MSGLIAQNRQRCGAKGAIVRAECELDSAVVGEIVPYGVVETAGESSERSSSGVERLRIVAPVEGYVSKRLLEDVNQTGVRLSVEFRQGSDIVLRTLGVRCEEDGRLCDLKNSLEAMTGIRAARQELILQDGTILNDESRLIKDLNVQSLILRENAAAPVPMKKLEYRTLLNTVANESIQEENTVSRPRQPVGTLLGGGFMTTKRRPNRGSEDILTRETNQAANISKLDRTIRISDQVDDDDLSDEEELPIVDIIPNAPLAAAHKRARFIVIFEGDRASRLVPHYARISVAATEAWRLEASQVCALVAERYLAVRGKSLPLNQSLRDARGYTLGPSEPALLYARGDRLWLVVKNCTDNNFTNHPSSSGKHTILLHWGANTPSISPARAPEPVSRCRVLDVACGWNHTVVATASGVTFAWGHNDFGQLGTGDEVRRPEPVPLENYYGLTKVVCGSHFTLGLNEHHELWSWGRYQAANRPSKLTESWTNDDQGIPRDSRIIACAAGDEHAAALVIHQDKSSSVYTWGYGTYGQLGHGTNTDLVLRKEAIEGGQRKPRRLHILPNNVTALACGGRHTAVLTSEGQVLAWGDKTWGQAPGPEPSTIATSASAVRCGRYATLIIDSSGKANLFGVLAPVCAPTFAADDPDAAAMVLPKQAEIVASDVVEAALGEAHALLLLKDGSLRGWGYNAYGQALGKLSTSTIIHAPELLDLAPFHSPKSANDTNKTAVTKVCASGGLSAVLIDPSS